MKVQIKAYKLLILFIKLQSVNCRILGDNSIQFTQKLNKIFFFYKKRCVYFFNIVFEHGNILDHLYPSFHDGYSSSSHSETSYAAMLCHIKVSKFISMAFPYNAFFFQFRSESPVSLWFLGTK